MMVILPTAWFYGSILPFGNWFHKYFYGFPIVRDRITFPQKFFASPCWICWKRSELNQKSAVRKRNRIKEFKRVYGEKYWSEEYQNEVKQVELESKRLSEAKVAALYGMNPS